jgi:hypothetical protein
VKTVPDVWIYNKSVATMRVVLRGAGSGVEVWILASDGVRHQEQFVDRETAVAFRMQIHDAIMRRGYQLVWSSGAVDAASGDS